MPRSTVPPAAATLALKALAFLADSDNALTRFMTETGADAQTLRQRADDPEFLAAVMDFLLAHEDLAAGFCAAESLDAQTLQRARMGLPGA